MEFNLSEIASHVRSNVLYEVSKLRIDQTMDLNVNELCPSVALQHTIDGLYDCEFIDVMYNSVAGILTIRRLH